MKTKLAGVTGLFATALVLGGGLVTHAAAIAVPGSDGGPGLASDGGPGLVPAGVLRPASDGGPGFAPV